MRRVLICSDTFYPDPMVASVRISQWCRHLPEFGWQPVVLTRHHGYQATPEVLARHLHPDVIVEYVNRSPDQAKSHRHEQEFLGRRLRRLARDVVSKVLVPDHTVVVWAQKRARALEAVQKYRPDLILTTSPPHGTHSIGLYLARKTGIPWVADYRDPHVIDRRFRAGGLLSALMPLHRRFERAVYAEASMVLHAIPFQDRFARMYYPSARGKVHVIENGVPAELLRVPIDLDSAPPAPDAAHRYSIRVVGTIEEREMLDVGKAVLILLEQGIDCELMVVGAVSPAAEVLRRDLGDRIYCTGYMRHEEALQRVADADVLLSYHGAKRAGNLQLTSKLFEFLATNRPIVAVNPTRPDRRLLRNVAGVVTLRHPGTDEVVRPLRTALAAAPRPKDSVLDFRRRYSRASQTEHLAALLETLVEKKPNPASESLPRKTA